MPITINGKELPDEAVHQEYQRLYQEQRQQQQQQQQQPMPEAILRQQLWKQATDRVIEGELIAQEAARVIDKIPADRVSEIYEQQFGKPSKAKKDKAQVDSQRSYIKRRLRMQMLIDRFAEGVDKPDDAAVEAWYTAHRPEFTQPESIHASHIVKHLKPEEDDTDARKVLDDALAEIRNGTPFAEMVQRLSDCSDQGGDLGWFPRGQMVEEFEEVAFNLPLETPSDVFRTPFGLHIVLVHEKRPAKVTPLDELRDRIREHLYQETVGKQIHDKVKALRDTAEIQGA